MLIFSRTEQRVLESHHVNKSTWLLANRTIAHNTASMHIFSNHLLPLDCPKIWRRGKWHFIEFHMGPSHWIQVTWTVKSECKSCRVAQKSAPSRYIWRSDSSQVPSHSFVQENHIAQYHQWALWNIFAIEGLNIKCEVQELISKYQISQGWWRKLLRSDIWLILQS